MLRGYDIVCISSLDWRAHWTSKQQIMHRLARCNRVLYVEEPVTMLAPLKVPEHWRRWARVIPRLRKVEADLWTLTLPPLLPFGNVWPPVNRLNQRVIAAYIRWACRRLGLRDFLLWTYLPTSAGLLDVVSRAATVYHCVDEHSAFPGFVRPEVVQAYDRELTSRADVVLTTAETLRASRQQLNPHVYHVPNAADVGLFRRALSEDLPLPSDVVGLSRPRVGVIGVHDERLDTEAIVAVASAEPRRSVLLIGPVRRGDVDEGRLRSLPNVHLLGGRPVTELPAYLKALDVALIPYKLNELTRSIFPLKLFEYLAGGVPVVATALPELLPFGDSIYLAAGPREFPELVERALREDSPTARAARVSFAARHTWEDRVETISRVIEEALARGGEV